MESKQDMEMPETEAAKVNDDREEVGKEQDHCLEDADVDMLDAQSSDKNEGVENDEVLDREKEIEESREDFSKLKVVELRSRLQEAGLNCRGTKSVLVERLRQASKEKKNEDEEETEEMEESES